MSLSSPSSAIPLLTPLRHALVFGGTGQIGQRVCADLLQAGWRVAAVSRQAQPPIEGLRWIKGDLQHSDTLPERVDAIFSCGPLDHFARWYAAAGVESPRVIAFGSTSIGVKRDSTDAQERDVAARLQQAENGLFSAAALRGAQATVLRPTLVYGAGRDKTLTQIAALARRTGFFVLPRSAVGLRQPVHVQDLADAALAVVDATATHGRSYAMPGGETLTYSAMVARTLAALTPPARLLRVPASLFGLALLGARKLGKLQGLNDAAVSRMSEDLVFDPAPAQQDFGYRPRAFRPTAEML